MEHFQGYRNRIGREAAFDLCSNTHSTTPTLCCCWMPAALAPAHTFFKLGAEHPVPVSACISTTKALSQIPRL